ncbi:uncharacterized protein LOC120686087 [Panicum virgatum]|uniref:Uncharacterized protein n=1 Tax=Panicum virgatum TaxID=38727 RepID=A0A8T0P5D6_PANVG|nr:uncharacterized protein LOC120686087 [Panicum virgatum]KAG2556850.1 hypothetical protein PVAP13_8NG155700 [Panicum virgatum]
MADAANEPTAIYYSGRPLSYDAQQAQATPPVRPQPTVGEHASALPATAQQPLQYATEKANHTHVHGVPGYYKGRVNKTNTAAVEPEKELSCIDKLLICFMGGKNMR